MKKIINYSLALSFAICFSQNNVKIDSTFNHYFKALELEISEKKDPAGVDSEYYNEVTLDDYGKVYINKYGNEAIIFLQEISKIKAPKKRAANTIAHYVNKDVLTKWKLWYNNNKNRIKWCDKKKKPYIPFLRRIFG